MTRVAFARRPASCTAPPSERRQNFPAACAWLPEAEAGKRSTGEGVRVRDRAGHLTPPEARPAETQKDRGNERHRSPGAAAPLVVTHALAAGEGGVGGGGRARWSGKGTARNVGDRTAREARAASAQKAARGPEARRSLSSLGAGFARGGSSEPPPRPRPRPRCGRRRGRT